MVRSRARNSSPFSGAASSASEWVANPLLHPTLPGALSKAVLIDRQVLVSSSHLFVAKEISNSLWHPSNRRLRARVGCAEFTGWETQIGGGYVVEISGTSDLTCWRSEDKGSHDRESETGPPTSRSRSRSCSCSWLLDASDGAERGVRKKRGGGSVLLPPHRHSTYSERGGRLRSRFFHQHQTRRPG